MTEQQATRLRCFRAELRKHAPYFEGQEAGELMERLIRAITDLLDERDD